MRKSVIDYMLFSCSAVIDYMLFSCDGRWTWGSGVRKSVIDYMFSCSAVMVGALGLVV